MSLFQVSVLKKHLKAQDKSQIEKVYEKFSRYFLNPTIQENIKSSKEEEYQGIFLTELFVNILDYTLKPKIDFNLVAEYKNQTNARKADGAILKEDIALGVIELKGTNTKHLEGIRQQAFDYKANQKGCVYVITSNFEKLRFYINDATEFLEFDLFNLSQEEFELLYLCLYKENLLSDLPLKIKEASIVIEEQITKEFYSDYSVFKRELYRDLVSKNAKRLKDIRQTELKNEELEEGALKNELANLEKNVKLSLFKKSQKLIDRFLFVFFAEDRGLLPPNSIPKILSDWNKLKDLDVDQPLYDRFKLYFAYLDTGRKGTDTKAEIFAYNGGLFKPDYFLDRIEIDDELLYKYTSKLSGYDFESQVDVNILGHIFENSLNEIESINAEIEGDTFDKQKSKRKKDGVFYTPKYITKYIVENTVGKLCLEEKVRLGFHEEDYFEIKKGTRTATKKNLLKVLDDYREWLLQLTICDPACGSGAFLNQALHFLIKEHEYIDELKAKVLGGGIVFSDIENTILENNIYGVDINEESVEIAKLSLWLRTAQPRRKLNDLSSNIKCGNSLIADKKVAGNKAFIWENEFPEVFRNGGFDVVIGNPPYGADFNQNHKIYISDSYFSYQYKFESYVYFYEKGITLLRSDGILSYITPELFLRLDRSNKVREFLNEYSTPMELKFCGENVFRDVQINSVVATFRKTVIKKGNISIIPQNNVDWEYSLNRWRNNKGLVFDFEINPKSFLIINKLREKSKSLGEYGDAIQGLTPYDSYTGQSKELIKSRAFHHSTKVDKSCGVWLNGKNVSRYSYTESPEWLQYGDWLASPREPEYFVGPRLLFREVPGSGKRIQCVYVDKKYYYGHSITPFKLSDEMDASILYRILAVVNSKLISWYASIKVSNFAKKTFPKLNPKDIRGLPLPIALENEDIRVLESNSITISQTFELLNNLSSQFENFIVSSFSLAKVSRKRQNWHDLDFSEFIKELNKTINKENRSRRKNEEPELPKLTKKDEFEWMELFEENKKEAVELQNQINQTETEIDQMVYELYGLTEEEIAIVENS